MSGRRWLKFSLVAAATALGVLLANLRLTFAQAVAAQSEPAGQTAAAPPAVPIQNTPGGVIQAQSNLVLVDAIVTDKKGNYIHGLEAKDFHVYEDDKEQAIASFSAAKEARPSEAPGERRYMVLFFDNASAPSPADQIVARRAAAKFVDNIPAGREIAVVNFGGALRITQNFTDKGDLLKPAVSSVNFSNVGSNSGSNTQVASLGGAGIESASAFGARTTLLAIRSLAKDLRRIPGRKSVVLFSAGFPIAGDPEWQAELTATVDACNKANVAVYPVDIRGLASTMPPTGQPNFPGLGPGASLFEGTEGSFPHQSGLLALALPPDPQPGQRPGGGAGGGAGGAGGAGGGRGGGGGAGGGGGVSGGGASGGGTGGRGGSSGAGGGSGATGTGTGTGTGGGTKGGTGTTTGGNTSRGGGGSSSYGNNPYNNMYNNPYNNPNYQTQQIVPPIVGNIEANQEVLYALAQGTGGFTILNTNDFLTGIEKVSKELDENYVLGYVPPAKNPEGSCHAIKVKLDQKGYRVRARSGYCDVKSPDLLAGMPEGKDLEALAAGSQPGNVSLAVKAPYFYSAPNVARVNLALQIPGDALNFDKEKGKFNSKVNVLGIAYRQDGSTAARFSDRVKLSLEKKEMKTAVKKPFTYQNTFDIAPGGYTLKLVLSPGNGSFAKLETPLVIGPYDGKQFGLSAVAMSDTFTPVSELTQDLDAALLEEKTPLVVKFFSNGKPLDLQLTLSPSNQFDRDTRAGFYVEVYEPLLLGTLRPRVGIEFSVVDKKSNQPVFDSGTMMVDALERPGNPVIPVGSLLPLDKLQAGDYRLEVTARDSEGRVSKVSSTDFQLN